MIKHQCTAPSIAINAITHAQALILQRIKHAVYDKQYKIIKASMWDTISVWLNPRVLQHNLVIMRPRVPLGILRTQLS